MKKQKLKAKAPQAVMQTPLPRSFNDNARLASRAAGAGRLSAARSLWTADPDLACLKKALERAEDAEVEELLAITGPKMSGSMRANALGLAMWRGLRLTAKRLMAQGASPRELALDNGELECLSLSQLSRYEAPINLALKRGQYDIARWLVNEKGAGAFAKPSEASSPFFAVALASRGTAVEIRAAMEWAIGRGEEPTEREAGILALAGRFEALDFLWKNAPEHRVPGLARASLSGLASISGDRGDWGRRALTALESAIALCEGKCERGVGAWDPRDASSLLSNYAKPGERAFQLAEKIRPSGRFDADRLGWPRLCALMNSSPLAFEALEAILPSPREFKELSLWSARVREASEGGAWTASQTLMGLSVAIGVDASMKGSLASIANRLDAWLDGRSMDRVIQEGGQVRKERAKKTARAARREAERARAAGEVVLEPIAVPAPAAPRRNRL